jgi:hypothetical protein
MFPMPVGANFVRLLRTWTRVMFPMKWLVCSVNYHIFIRIFIFSAGDLLPSSNLIGYDHPALINVPKTVVQFDIRDVDNDLIRPADVPSKLKPGTLVLLSVCPVCWVFNEAKRIKKVRYVPLIYFIYLSLA